VWVTGSYDPDLNLTYEESEIQARTITATIGPETIRMPVPLRPKWKRNKLGYS